MDILNELEVEFYVAPYEADAQMSYMVKQGIADFAISEDSDLVAYGCPRIMMKMDHMGSCKEFNYDDFKEFEAKSAEEKKTGIESLQALDQEQFMFACAMAGCEYLPNIDRVGLKVALKHFGKH